MEAWRVALTHHDRPVGLVLTRQNVPVLDRTRLAPASGLAQGAYTLYDPPASNGGSPDPDLIIIATGSEVSISVEAAERLAGEGIRARVVSMPSWDLRLPRPLRCLGAGGQGDGRVRVHGGQRRRARPEAGAASCVGSQEMRAKK
jgi:hypothetical protein